MKDIVFIQTGGTIDKDYPRGETNHGYAFAIGEPAVKSILEAIHPQFSYRIVEFLKKDSLDIDEEDRVALKAKIDSLGEERVIITHGTDTIFQTGTALKEVEDKTIVLTGAMLPEKFVGSDAKFNIGMAASSAMFLGPGVYVALYGRVVLLDEFPALHEAFEKEASGVETSGEDFDHQSNNV